MSLEPTDTQHNGSSPIITLIGDSQPMVVGPQQLSVLAGAATGSPVGLVDYRIAPGFAPPPYLLRHTHEDAGWVVLEGTVEFHLEDGGSMETFAPRLAELRHRYGLEPHPDASVPGQATT